MAACLGASGKGHGLHLESKIRKERGPAESTVPFKGTSPVTPLPLGSTSSPLPPPSFPPPPPLLCLHCVAQAGLELMTLVFLPHPD